MNKFMSKLVRAAVVVGVVAVVAVAGGPVAGLLSAGAWVFVLTGK
jgi:hypothetical protein